MPPKEVVLLVSPEDPVAQALLAFLRAQGLAVDLRPRAGTPTRATEPTRLLVLELPAQRADEILQALDDPILAESLEEAERRQIARVLALTKGNRKQAASRLGIARSTLLTKLRRYGLALLLSLPPHAGQAQSLSLPPGRVIHGLLSFDGHATAGDFTGRTTAVRGIFSGGTFPAVTGWVAAPVDSLTTANKRRDRDMRSAMESKTYPEIRFDLLSADLLEQTGDTLRVTLHGPFTFHGVSDTVAIAATVIHRGDTLTVTASTPADLRTYRIGGLRKLLGMLRMYEDIVIHFDVTFFLAPLSRPNLGAAIPGDDEPAARVAAAELIGPVHRAVGETGRRKPERGPRET